MSARSRLILQSGEEFRGTSFGANTATAGEVVFTTGMTGYVETLTDPSYCGQIVVFTYPLIGNYGVPESKIEHDLETAFESNKIYAKGVIVSEHCIEHSHHNALKNLDKWLKEQGIPALSGIDTRALTTYLRSGGTCLGKIGEADWYDPNKDNLLEQVSVSKPKLYLSTKAKRKRLRVALLDCGVKNNIIHSFLKRGVDVLRLPYDWDLSNVDYDGLFISNGPGNPANYKITTNTIRSALLGKKPVWGICLGNQLLALAAGAKTYKLPFGHRSHNQPCKLVGTKRCFITSQNHGYAVDGSTLPKEWNELFVNANDQSNEGIKHVKKPFSSCQFHPEACPGPEDTAFLFDTFIAKMKQVSV